MLCCVCVCVIKLRFWLPLGQTPSPYPNSRQYTPLSKNCLKVCPTSVALETTPKKPVVLSPVNLVSSLIDVFMSGDPAGVHLFMFMNILTALYVH